MITQEQIDEFKKQVASICVLLDIEITNTDNTKTFYYYTTYDIPVLDYETNIIYNPFPFYVENFNYSIGMSIDNLILVLDNVKLQEASIVLNKDQRGNQVIIKYAILDEQGNVDVAIELFSGKISSIELDNKTARFTIKHDLLFWSNSTLRLQHYGMFPNQADIKVNQVLQWGAK